MAQEEQDENTNDLVVQKFKEKMELMVSEITIAVKEQLQKITNRIIDDLEQNQQLAGRLQNIFTRDCYDEIQDKIQTKKGELPNKHFMTRNSLLTDLFQISHIQTIYHIFIATLFGLFVNTTAYDFIYKGKTSMGFRLILNGFVNMQTLIFVCICMYLSTFLVYICFYIWSTFRIQKHPKSTVVKLWDKLGAGLYILYVPCFIYYFTNSVVSYKLTSAECTAALCELTRFLMKTYAFIRENVPKTLKYKLHTENEAFCPEFSQFLYFLFAPTLIYKDTYPRTKTIRWNYVVMCFVEVMGCIFYISFVLERFMIPNFEDFGIKKYKWQDIMLIILGNGMAGILVMLATFYAILHAWMNGVAEMLRFGDRMFYKDWWTSSSYGRYYRTWNVVVHDWLYTYIYRDLYENLIPKNKFIAKFMVFLVSALFHEFIIGFSFKFCFPVLFVQFFGFGLALSFLKAKYNSVGNIAMWYGLALGMGIGISMYCMEFYARVNCPSEDTSFASYFIPRSFACNS